MGGGKGASSTQTVSIPPEVMARYNAVNARAENVAQTPFTPYSTSPEAFVAPLTASQQAGIANINALQGSATPDVRQGQGLQMQGIDTAQRAQAESRGIDLAALQGISQAQQQGTAYNQAAGQNIFNAMGSAAPYMQQMAGLTQAGLGQGQQYLGGATGLTQQAIQTGQQYARQAQPYYTGALQAAQPLNQAAQQYMQAGAQAVGPEALNYSQYMNPYMKDVVQAQQALQAQENAQQRAALQGKAVQAGAFGGDRAAIEQANLARQQSLANQATLANLLQSGYGQAQQMAAQQQGVGLSAAQANRAAQQQAAQQAAALGQQGYAQQLGLGQALAALGQQQYGQALGTGAQIGQLGQQGYTQNLGAGAQLGNVGQQLYAQNIGQGQAIQGLGQQQFAQGLAGSQAAAGIGQNLYGMGAQTAGLQQAGGMNIANLGLQNQAAQIAAAQAQMAAGQQQQQTEQAGKTALYNQFLQQQGYPFQIAQFLANIAEGTGALSGSTTSATRTGNRGGRMGDGYASGGLVPPDSQGGAVLREGAYANGGPPGMVPDGEGGWRDDGPEAYQRYLRSNLSTANTQTATNPNDYDQIVRNAYGSIGRSGIGANASNIDQAGYDYWMNRLKSGELTPDTFNAQFSKEANAYVAANPNAAASQVASPQLGYQAVAGVNKDIASAFKDATGKDIDAASARKYQDMMNAGMSLDQIKYNIGQSQPALLKAGDVGALRGQPLTYDPSKFQQPAAPVLNQYGSYAAPSPGFGMPQATGKGAAPAQSYGGYGGGYGGYGGGYGSPMMGGYGGGYGGYDGGYGRGYGIPSNYGMPNFGSSSQYGGAPDYAGAALYAGNQYNMSQYGMPPQMGGYGMPNAGYGGGYGQFQQQQAPQAPQATGKGAAPAQQQGPSIPQNVLSGYGQPSQSAPQSSMYSQFQQQQAPQATGKGASGTGSMGGSTTVPQGVLDQYNTVNSQQTAPQSAMYSQFQQQQAPQATGKGSQPVQSQAPTATGKGASGMKSGGRAAFADGGRAGYALHGYVPVPGDPYGALQAQQAAFAGVPGMTPGMGYVPQTPSGAGQYKLMTPQASILPQRQNAIKEAASMGTSVASLGDAGTKLYNKLAGPSTTGAQDAEKMFNKLGAAKQADIDAASGLVDPSKTGFFGGLFGGGNANGGRIGYSDGGIPGLDDLKQGKADIPGGEGTQTPMSKVVAQGTQTPTELKAEMDRMSSGSGGLGGSSGNSIAGTIGTAASLVSLGNTAMNVGSWIATKLPFFFAASGGRIGKAGGGALIHTDNPRYHQMQVAFDNFVQRYDHNPLLAAAAMDVGPEVVDAAIIKAQKTGKDITDFLPRRTQEYMFALSQAALGAHQAIQQRTGRATGGRTGYALEGGVEDQPKGLNPAPSQSMTPEDVGGGLAPQEMGPQLAAYEQKNPEILKALRMHENPKEIPNLRNPTPGSTASGLYQYIDKTWKKVAPQAGVDISKYPTAGSAPEDIQHMVADKNVDSILAASKGNILAVANVWYSGNPQGKISAEDVAYNKGLTQEEFNRRFLANLQTVKSGNAPEVKPSENQAPTAPTQVASATGLAGGTKSDAAPWETIGKKILPDAVPTDSSFWVPLIAGLGSMLASDEYRFSRRLGAGLVGGAAAYGKQQELGMQQQKIDIERQNNAIAMFGKLFQPQYNKNGQLEYLNVRTGEVVSPEVATQIMFGAGSPFAPTAKPSAGLTGGTSAPQISAPPVAAPTVQQAIDLAKGQPAKAEPSKAEPEKQPTVVQPSEFKTFEDVDAWARSHPRVADLQGKADDQKVKITEYQNELDKLPSNPLTATRRTELTTLLANARTLEQNYRREANEQANNLATPYKAQLQKKFEVSPEMAEAEAGKAAGVKSAESNVKYFEDQAAADQARQQTRVQLRAIQTILENYQSGTFAQEKAQLVGALRAAGIDVPSSATANPAAFEEFTKHMMKNVFNGVKEIGGQIRVAEMAGLEKASNNPSMQPEANKKVLSEAIGILNAADKRYSDEVSAYGDQGPTKFNRAKFQLDWRKAPENDPQKFILEAEKNTAVRGATPSDLSDMSEGHVYVIEPNNAFGVAIDKPQKLRFMGINPETGNPRWQKVQ